MGVLGGIIRGVGFDLDGTFYANWRLNIRIVPFAFGNLRFLAAFGKTRHILHREAAAGKASAGPLGASEDLYDYQAQLMAEALGGDAAAMKAKLEKDIYRYWEKCFAAIKPFPLVRETVEAFRAAGLKTGLLSDFPPARKLAYLGLGAGLFDAVLCSEETGAVKPHPLPFRRLAEALGLQPEEMLYVGNSPAFDIVGAKNCGMKAALLRKGPLSTGKGGGEGARRADFIFGDYRQLQKFVLG